jgi:hypothetical protein
VRDDYQGTSQVVAINTPGVSDSTCTLISSTIGTQTVVTPATLTLAKGSDNISVRCRKDCYQDGVGVISSNMESMTAGNIIVGGLIGLSVDAMTGAMNKYTPEIQVAMTPIPGCRSTTQLMQPPQVQQPTQRATQAAHATEVPQSARVTQPSVQQCRSVSDLRIWLPPCS